MLVLGMTHCERACGWQVIYVLGLHVSLWRSSCPTLNASDAQISLQVRESGKYTSKLVCGSLTERRSNGYPNHHSSARLICSRYFSNKYVQSWWNTKKWGRTESRQTLSQCFAAKAVQSFCLLIKTGLQWNVPSPQGSACRLLQSSSVPNWQPVRPHKRPQWGGWTTGVTGLVKGKR